MEPGEMTEIAAPKYNPRGKGTVAIDNHDRWALERRKAARVAMDPSISWAPTAGLAKSICRGSPVLKVLREQKIKDLSNTEARTVYRSVQTWDEWVRFLKKEGKDPGCAIPPALLQCWVEQAPGKSGPMCRYHRVRWLFSRLAAPLPATELRKPRAAPEKTTQPVQAVIAEPAMLKHLEERLHRGTCGTRKAPAVCVALIIATAVVRFKHVQRSVFAVRKTEGTWCRCSLGKASSGEGARKSFLWYAPKVTLTRTAPRSPIEHLHRHWQRVSAKIGKPLDTLAFDGHTGKMLSLAQFHTILREEMAEMLLPEQIKWISSYSFRRIGATVTRILHLDMLDEHIFGGWTATEGCSGAKELKKSMPTRYNGRRATQEEQLKVAVWKTVEWVFEASSNEGTSDTWEDLECSIARACELKKVSGMSDLLQLARSNTNEALRRSSAEAVLNHENDQVVERRFRICRGERTGCQVQDPSPQHGVPRATTKKEKDRPPLPPRGPKRVKVEEQAKLTPSTAVKLERVAQPSVVTQTALRGLYLAGVQERNRSRTDIPRCGEKCTISQDGLCTRACWLPHNHSGGLSCDHACKNCWLDAPIDIKCVKDKCGLPTIRPKMKVERAEAEQSKTRTGRAVPTPPKTTKAHALEKVATWFTADKKGTWSKRVHAVVFGPRGE